MYPYSDTRAEPVQAGDDRDERAARRTLRFLAVALFIAVLAVTVFASLVAVHNNDVKPTAATPPVSVETVTTLPAPVAVGPAAGTELTGYVSARKAALASVADDRVAVVSLAKYSTPAQAKALAGTATVMALLVAPPGIAPAVVAGDLAEWSKTQTAATAAERDEIKKLIPTVTDAGFKAFYTAEVARLDKAVKGFAPDSTLVFGFVVRAPAAALKALAARPEVRLVDVAGTASPGADALYRGLRPEEVATANDPAMRPG